MGRVLIGEASLAAVYAVQEACDRFDFRKRPREAASACMAMLVAWGRLDEALEWAQRGELVVFRRMQRMLRADDECGYALFDRSPFVQPRDTASNDDDATLDECDALLERACSTALGRALEHARSTSTRWRGAADAVAVAVDQCAAIAHDIDASIVVELAAKKRAADWGDAEPIVRVLTEYARVLRTTSRGKCAASGGAECMQCIVESPAFSIGAGALCIVADPDAHFLCSTRPPRK